MRTLKVLSIFLICVFIICSTLFAQGFQPPTKGKAVIYFIHLGKTQNIEYFHNDKFIGVFKSKSYMRYESDPGEQLFWASCENKKFITANLEEGESYIVITDAILGYWKFHVELNPISINDTELFESAKKLINKKEPVVTPEEEIAKMNMKLEEFIAKELENYKEVAIRNKNFKHIFPAMAIPEDAMK